MNAEQWLFELLRALLHGTPVSVAPSFEEFSSAYALAEYHDLAHMVYEVLEKQQALPTATTDGQKLFLEKAAKSVFAAQYRYVRLEAELAHVDEVLATAQIPYLPMKGSVMRHLYPQPWMRTSCDIDMLVHDRDVKRAVDLLTAEGFTTEGVRASRDISLFCSDVHLELHHSIMERHGKMDVVLERVWDYVEGEGYRYTETPTFFRFHHLAHMAHHFLFGGCGIRPVMDLWLLRRAPDHDESALRAMCEEGGLLTFYETVCRLGAVWFDGHTHDADTRLLAQYILSGGKYGTASQRTLSFSAAYGSKGIAKRLLFVPYENLKNLYPSLKGKPYLAPLYRVYHSIKRVCQGQALVAFRRVRDVGNEEKNAAQLHRLFESMDLLSQDGG